MFCESGMPGECLVRYDVPVGRGQHKAAHEGEADLVPYSALLRKRMDVLLTVQGEDFCGEIKGLGGASALGQALLYAHHYHDPRRYAPPARGLVVCRSLDWDCLPLFLLHRVAVWEVHSLSWVVPL